MLEPAQLKALRSIEDETGAPVARQIRRAVDLYLKERDKTQGKRPASRKSR
jgi:hypothetical protein